VKGSQWAHSKLVSDKESCSTVPLGQYRGPGDDQWRGCMPHVDALDAVVKIKTWDMVFKKYNSFSTS
jgi:hypothetical protein